MDRIRAFVSYSRKDGEWLSRFRDHAAILERAGFIDIWDDTRLRAGDRWEQELEDALSTARIAILMISPNFLASQFIWEREIPAVLRHREAGMLVLPLVVRPCAWEIATELSQIETRPRSNLALSECSQAQIDSELKQFVIELKETLNPTVSNEPIVNRQSSSITRDLHLLGMAPGAIWEGRYFANNRSVQMTILKAESGQVELHLLYEDGSKTSGVGTFKDIHKDGVFEGIELTFVEAQLLTPGKNGVTLNGTYSGQVASGEFTGQWTHPSVSGGSFKFIRAIPGQ